VSFLLVPSAVGAESPLGQSLHSLLATLPDQSAVAGACVIDLASGSTVFAHHADQPMVPASNMKVFAMAAAINELGTDFVFETILAVDGHNLYVIGDGDPAFADEKLYRARNEPIHVDFDRWAGALRERGLATVPGDLVIDESIFDGQFVHPSWERGDLDNWYAAPVGGLNINDNCVDITVSPAGRGGPVQVAVEPDNSLLRIINKCKSGGKGSPLLNLHHGAAGLEYIISGRCTKRWTFEPVSFPDPGLLFADSLRTALAKRGVMVQGGVQRGRVRDALGRLPNTLTVVARKISPLADVLRRTGKDSQNLFAECLLKRTGYAWAKRHGLPDPQGSWKLGAAATWDWLTQAGVPTGGLVIADGSGLSRDNRCTARQLAATMAWIHSQPGSDLFRASLSIAGIDGSLRKQLTDMPGLVQGKTGTMRGVRTLSGYVSRGSGGGGYAVAVMFNGYKGPAAPYKTIQDRICRTLAGKRVFQKGATGSLLPVLDPEKYGRTSPPVAPDYGTVISRL